PSKWVSALADADLGDALLADGRIDESLRTLERAQSLLLASQHNGSPDLADIAVDIARAEIALGHSDRALASAPDAVTFGRRFDANHRNTGIGLLWQAGALAATGNASGAADAMRRASDILATTGLPADQAVITQPQGEIRASPIVQR